MPQNQESKLQSSIVKFLTDCGIKIFRNTSGAFQDGRGGWIRYGLKKGSADLIGVLPGGRFLSIEVKSSSTAPVRVDQLEWQKEIISVGGIALIVHSLDDLAEALREYLPAGSVQTKLPSDPKPRAKRKPVQLDPMKLAMTP